MLSLATHTDFKSEIKAFAATKLLLDIWPNISNISVLRPTDIALAPATLKGKKYNMPPIFVVFKDISV
jgi:hypothetical protein